MKRLEQDFKLTAYPDSPSGTRAAANSYPIRTVTKIAGENSLATLTLAPIYLDSLLKSWTAIPLKSAVHFDKTETKALFMNSDSMRIGLLLIIIS